MSRMSQARPARRVRRQFSDEFKAGAIRLVLEEGKTVGALARELDLTPSALAEWVRRAQADRTQGRTGLTGVEREELVRFRKEVRELRMEREVLKKRFLTQMCAQFNPEQVGHAVGRGCGCARAT